MIPLNQVYTTFDGRIFKTLFNVYVRDENGNTVDGIRLVEDIPGKPLPVIHDRSRSEIERLISGGQIRPVRSGN